MAWRKTIGDHAELRVASDLVGRGYRVAFPWGEDWVVDLVLSRSPALPLERMQVKSASSDGRVLTVKCFTQSMTGGRVNTITRYTSREIDWLAVYDATTDRCYYVPAAELEDGRTYIHLRLQPARNGQRRGVRDASNYMSI